jgi:hypothetical protein
MVSAINESVFASKQYPQQPSGAVYMYQHTAGGWQLQQRLTPLDSDMCAVMGEKVAISGNYAVTTSGSRNAEGHCIYLFRRDTMRNVWLQEQKISPADPKARESFGWSISLHGNRLVVSAPFEHLQADSNRYIENAGAAYVYQRAGNGWSLQQRLTAPQPHKGQFFATTVAIGDYYLMTATPNQNLQVKKGPILEDAGAAFIYHFDAKTAKWKLQQQLTSDDPVTDGWFGSSISTDGSTAIVGLRAMVDTTAAVRQPGAVFAYLYKRKGTSWRYSEKILTQGLNYHHQEGQAVAVSGDHAIAGSYMDKGMAGSIYLLTRNRRNTWASHKYTLADAYPTDMFGISVDITTRHAIAGAYQKDNGTGAAYIIALPE